MTWEKHEKENVLKMLEKLQERESTDFFNGDKRELFVRLASIETKISDLPCKEHKTLMNKVDEKANGNTNGIQKTKTWVMGLALTFLGGVIGYTMLFLINNLNKV